MGNPKPCQVVFRHDVCKPELMILTVSTAMTSSSSLRPMELIRVKGAGASGLMMTV